jgi:hypothetical protein
MKTLTDIHTPADAVKPIFYTTAEKLPLHQPLASAGSA